METARAFLRYTAAMGELSDREHAILAMGDWGDAEAFDFLVNELKDRGLPIRIRRVVLTSLAKIQSEHSMSYLIQALGHPDISIQETAADLLAQIGEPALAPVLAALQIPVQEEGALRALQTLPMPMEKPVEEYARAAVARAVEYDALRRGLNLKARLPKSMATLTKLSISSRNPCIRNQINTVSAPCGQSVCWATGSR
jgi:HEAT repeat protein